MHKPSEIAESNLFDTYSKNLSYAKPDLKNIFICPLCLKTFTRLGTEATNKQAPELTIEHLPPKSLGGKPQTITCKQCNNYAGRSLDSDLLNSLLLRDFFEKRPGASVDSTINGKIKAKFEVIEKSKYRLSYPGNRNNPQGLLEFQKNYPESMKLNFRGEYQKPIRINRPDWSLLRIAYLWLFSVFGYGFILNNSNLNLIRQQINNPDEKILKYWAYESNFNLPDEFLGINLITAPHELQSFLVVFDLITPRSVRRHGILIPGPTDPGINIYEALEKTPNREDISIKNIPKNKDYLSNPNLHMASYIFWEALNRP